MGASAKTVRISAGRFEQSPYFEFYADKAKVLGVAAGRYFACEIDENPVETYWTLRRKAVLFDVPEKPWQIEGPDAAPFLEKIFARRIGNLTFCRGRYVVACTAEGGAYMDGILFRFNDNCFWFVQPDGAFEEWTLAHRVGFDVRISDPGSRVLQIQGPNSMKIMSDASQGAIDESMKYFHAGYFDLGGQQVYVSRTGWTGELGYEVYSESGKTDCEKLWNHLFDAGTPHGMVFGSLNAMGTRRIEAGIMDCISDFDASMTPYEAGLGAFIELDKEGFIGREALLNAGRSTLMYGIKCTSAAPHDGAEVWEGDVCAGHLTASAWSPFQNCGIAYVRFNSPNNWSGKRLTLKLQLGEQADCEIVALPFYDAKKKIPRGIERPVV